jgi:hypothetical protein
MKRSRAPFRGKTSASTVVIAVRTALLSESPTAGHPRRRQPHPAPPGARGRRYRPAASPARPAAHRGGALAAARPGPLVRPAGARPPQRADQRSTTTRPTSAATSTSAWPPWTSRFATVWTGWTVSPRVSRTPPPIPTGRSGPHEPRRSGAFPNAPKRTRTSTGLEAHKALNLARLPIPPPAQVVARRKPRGAPSIARLASVLRAVYLPEHMFAAPLRALVRGAIHPWI